MFGFELVAFISFVRQRHVYPSFNCSELYHLPPTPSLFRARGTPPTWYVANSELPHPHPPGSGDRIWLGRCVSVACALLSYLLRPERFIRPRCISPDHCPQPTHTHIPALQWYERAEGAFIQPTSSMLGIGKHSIQLYTLTLFSIVS